MWSVVVDNLVSAPRFAGTLTDTTHEGTAGIPGEGPFLHLGLVVDGTQIVEARYTTFGCPAALASGEMLCLLLRGRACEWAQTLTSGDLTRALGGLPEGKEHCPQLAIEALRQALRARPLAPLHSGDNMP